MTGLEPLTSKQKNCKAMERARQVPKKSQSQHPGPVEISFQLAFLQPFSHPHTCLGTAGAKEALDWAAKAYVPGVPERVGGAAIALTGLVCGDGQH